MSSTFNDGTPASSGAFTSAFYGSLDEAEDYFAEKLHADAWIDATAVDQEKALIEATVIIDRLNFKGYKASVYTLLLATPDATEEAVRAEELSQELEFPRDADSEVPVEIERACYEIAINLLDGRDPELDFENLAATGQRYGSSVSTSYDRQMAPQEHIANMVPSVTAWKLLRPFLRDSNEVRLDRIT